MRLRPIKANTTELVLDDGYTVLFSYQTPVAAQEPGGGYLRTNKKWSKTTTRHINQWLAGATAAEVNQEVLDSLALGNRKESE
jgi:hypothetical protein